MTFADAPGRLRAFDLPAGDYAVHGSAAMLLHGRIGDGDTPWSGALRTEAGRRWRPRRPRHAVDMLAGAC